MRRILSNLLKKVFLLVALLNVYLSAQAQPDNNVAVVNNEPSAVEQRVKSEKKTASDPYVINFYKPTYIMPFYYTGSPYNSIYENNTPDNETINKAEVKYQLSFKVPIWSNIFCSHTSLFFAYTQLSYWQLYNNSAFFRETDYEPEFFFANEINHRLYKNWDLNFINLGFVHQSNGFGGDMERTWNRIYLNAITSVGDWMINIKPWYIIHDGGMEEHNPDIGDYLGYGEVLVGYKYHHQVFTIQVRNLIENSKRATAELSWSFPLTKHLNGYVQFFTGYGQSLIEYDHHTNSAGIGIALSNWL